MEELVKKLVEEEVKRQYEKTKTPTASSNNGESTEEKRTQATSRNNGANVDNRRTPQVATRLNGLLNRVRHNAATPKQSKIKSAKPMTIQVRYIRETEEGKEYIQQNKGGGNRFVQVENSDATFADLLDRCFQIYFIDGENYFYEKREDVEAVILDVAERVVGEEKISSFLSARGLFPSVSQLGFISKQEAISMTKKKHNLW